MLETLPSVKEIKKIQIGKEVKLFIFVYHTSTFTRKLEETFSLGQHVGIHNQFAPTCWNTQSTTIWLRKQQLSHSHPQWPQNYSQEKPDKGGKTPLQ